MRLHRLTDSSASNENNPSSSLSSSVSTICTQDKHSETPPVSTVCTITQATKVSSHYKIPKLRTHESTPSNKTPSADDTMNRKTKEYIGMICKPSLSLSNGRVPCFHSKSSTAWQQEKGQKDSEPSEFADDRTVAENNQKGRILSTENSNENNYRKNKSQTNSRIPHVFTCAECDETFVKAKDLSRHMIDHPNYDEKTSRYRCPKCQETFENLINLRRHIVIAHTKLDKLNVSNKTNTYECSICKQGFHTLLSFKVSTHAVSIVSSLNIFCTLGTRFDLFFLCCFLLLCDIDD